MSKQKQRSNLRSIESRYENSSRTEKSRLLNGLCDLYHYTRKYLVQYFNGLATKKYLRRGYKKKYDKKILLPALKNIWLATNQRCSKKLIAAIPLWLPFYDVTFGVLADSIKQQLLTISAASIDRMLKPIKAKYKKHGLTGTKPGYFLKNQIPVKTDHWDVRCPGFMEADTVAHCGILWLEIMFGA